MKFSTDYISIKNTMYIDKPNEDFYICDDENGIYIILDGVSRDIVDGKYPSPSPARRVSEIFALSVHKHLQHSLNGGGSDFQTMIREAMVFGNDCIADFNSQDIYSFPPGTVGIVLIIKACEAHFGFIGDCTGKIVSYDNTVLFTRDQTKNVDLYRNEYNQARIRSEICNNPNHPAGYGVLNGSKAALGFIESGCFELPDYEKVLLYTDGFEQALSSLPPRQLYNLSLNKAGELSELAGSKYMDDRTLLIISRVC